MSKGIKKSLRVFLTVAVAFSLVFVGLHTETHTANADEGALAESEAEAFWLTQGAADEPTPSQEDRGEQALSDSAGGGAAGEHTSAAVPSSKEQEPPATGTLLPATDTPSLSATDTPYWLSDGTYQRLLAEYDTAVAQGQAAGIPPGQAAGIPQGQAAAASKGQTADILTTAKLVVSGSAAGSLAGAITVGAGKVISNGTNAPAYDNGAGELLTPLEGLPTAGMSSDRSLLRAVGRAGAGVGSTGAGTGAGNAGTASTSTGTGTGSPGTGAGTAGTGTATANPATATAATGNAATSTTTADATIYEATFFFGSDRWPEAPFTAFRTYVVLSQSPTQTPKQATDTPQTTQGQEDTASQAGDNKPMLPAQTPLTLQESAASYSALLEELNAVYAAPNYDIHWFDAAMTIEACADDIITASISSDSASVLTPKVQARLLTTGEPKPGQTSTAVLLTKQSGPDTATVYKARFYFGEEGAQDGFAVGECEITLSLPSPTLAQYVAKAEPNPPILPKPGPKPGVPDDNIGPQNADLSPYIKGGTITSYVAGASNWNGSIYHGTFTIATELLGEMRWITMNCLDPGRPGPSGPFSVSYVGQPITWTVKDANPQGGYLDLYGYCQGPRGTQRLEQPGYRVPGTFTGAIDLVKSSSNTSITNGNPLYSLAGAQYGLYASYEAAQKDTGRIHTFTTNADGTAKRATGIALGTYYLRELVAPKGYELDPVIYEVKHNTTLVTSVERSDKPLGDPMQMLVQKLDARTGGAYGVDDPQGLLLADGEFTVKYYSGYYDTVEATERVKPARVWVFKTSARGVAYITPNYLLSGDGLYYNNLTGSTTLPLGTITIQETKAPPGYLLPDPNPINIQQIKQGTTLNSVKRLNPKDNSVVGTLDIYDEPRSLGVEKQDADTSAPIPNTEFTLYKESTPGAGEWKLIATHLTDEYGKISFSPIAPGSYKLDETKPEQNYAEIEESGDSAHYFEIGPKDTPEVQVFKNKLIQVSIEVYKKTIALTGSAHDGTDNALGNNVGLKEYLYHFGARSNSNVRVDEFVVTDSLEFVSSKGYRMTTLWTGTAPEGMDYDGLMHILYKTNKTAPDEPVHFTYNPMSANPPNPNNPDNNMSVSTEPGWRIWKECVSTTQAIRLEVADLKLAQDEYLIGIRAVYGGVVKGFYTGKGWDSATNPKTNQGNTDSLSTLDAGELTPFELRDWSYAVVATEALRPIDEMGNETVMQGSIKADLFRNWGEGAPVLTDIDKDSVETRVVASFKFDKESLGITPGGFYGRFGILGFSLPYTGDTLWIGIIVATLLASLGFSCIYLARRRKAARGEGR